MAESLCSWHVTPLSSGQLQAPAPNAPEHGSCVCMERTQRLPRASKQTCAPVGDAEHGLHTHNRLVAQHCPPAACKITAPGPSQVWSGGELTSKWVYASHMSASSAPYASTAASNRRRTWRSPSLRACGPARIQASNTAHVPVCSNVIRSVRLVIICLLSLATYH